MATDASAGDEGTPGRAGTVATPIEDARDWTRRLAAELAQLPDTLAGFRTGATNFERTTG